MGVRSRRWSNGYSHPQTTQFEALLDVRSVETAGIVLSRFNDLRLRYV